MLSLGIVSTAIPHVFSRSADDPPLAFQQATVPETESPNPDETYEVGQTPEDPSMLNEWTITKMHYDPPGSKDGKDKEGDDGQPAGGKRSLVLGWDLDRAEGPAVGTVGPGPRQAEAVQD